MITSMQPLSIAVVGLGYWGPNWLRNISLLDDCKLSYGCDMNAARCKKFAAMYPATAFTSDYEKMLEDPSLDAVIIATPTSSHYPLAAKALNAGKHVLVEKPMTSKVEEAKKLVALAKKRKKVLAVDHTFAFTESVKKIQSYVESKKLGDLLYFDSTRINLGLIQKDTDVLHDLAVHDLTILHAIQPLSGVTEVFACGSAYYGKQPEIGHLHLKFASGLHAHIHVSWISPVKIRSTIIGGSKAMIVFDDVEPSEKLRLYDKGVEHDHTKPDPFFPKYRSGDVTIPALPMKEALLSEAEHFAACIRGKAKPIVSGEAGLMMLKILETALLSMKKGAPIRMQRSH